jgi:hypothetical protein
MWFVGVVVGPLPVDSVDLARVGMASSVLALTCSAPDVAVSLTVSMASRAGSLRVSTTSCPTLFSSSVSGSGLGHRLTGRLHFGAAGGEHGGRHEAEPEGHGAHGERAALRAFGRGLRSLAGGLGDRSGGVGD